MNFSLEVELIINITVALANPIHTQLSKLRASYLNLLEFVKIHGRIRQKEQVGQSCFQ
jgi:hypothetical protein